MSCQLVAALCKQPGVTAAVIKLAWLLEIAACHGTVALWSDYVLQIVPTASLLRIQACENAWLD